ncbi:MAG: hypothetical protein U1E73_10725 [Planctomycetota bacterium]
MAHGVRTRLAVPLLIAAGAAVVAGACGDEPRPLPHGAPPTAVDLAAVPPAEIPARVLQECHAPLRGAMRCVAVTVTLPGAREVRVFAELPENLRTAENDGRYLLRGDEAFRLDDGSRPVTAAIRGELRALRQLVDAAALGPIHRATACTATAAKDTFALAGPDGTTVGLRLRPATLLPAEFAFGTTAVAVLDYLRTPTTWIPSRLAHPALGECTVHFELSDLTFADDLFTPPGAERDGPAAPQSKWILDKVDQRSPVPVLDETRAVRWVVLDDPGDWAARAAAYAPWDRDLQRQQQVIAGFPILTTIDGRRVLAIAFRPRAGAAAIALPAGTRELAFGDGRELYVYPATGDLDARGAEGERLLLARIARDGLVAEGAVRYQPYLHLEDGAPTAEQLANPTVRVSIRVRPR